jgi:hypothetical protein
MFATSLLVAQLRRVAVYSWAMPQLISTGIITSASLQGIGVWASRLGVGTPLSPRAAQQQRRVAVLYHSALVRQLLLRFATFTLGIVPLLSISRNLQSRLAAGELAFLAVQNQRLLAHMSAPARGIQQAPWAFGATAVYLAVMLRDPHLLVAWLQSRMRTMTLFQHRRFFRTLALTLATAVATPAHRYSLRGLRLSVIGKLSVTGNAMTRTYALRLGSQGNATLGLRLTQAFTLVRTRTGCLGVTFGFYF